MLGLPIRLHDSLIINIFGESQLISQFFMHAISDQGKVTSETITFRWVWPVVKLLVKLGWRILRSSISLKRII